jgi:Tfp pilus assembly ATPase PilU
MYSMDDLLHLVNCDGADELRLHVGAPPVLVVRGDQYPLDAPPIIVQVAEELLQSITNTRQRRELRERGVAHFVYRYRDVLDVLVCAKMENERIGIDIRRHAGPQKEK